jgi:hypothetical protein
VSGRTFEGLVDSLPEVETGQLATSGMIVVTNTCTGCGEAFPALKARPNFVCCECVSGSGLDAPPK